MRSTLRYAAFVLTGAGFVIQLAAAQTATPPPSDPSVGPHGSATAAENPSSVNGEATEQQATASQDHQQGLIELRAGQKKEAVRLLRSAVTKAPNDAVIATDLGYALMRAGRYEEAEGWFRKGIELDPKRAHAYIHLADTVAREANRWEKRQEILHLLAAGLSNVSNGEAHYNILLGAARLNRALGLLKTAQLQLEGMLKDSPDAPAGLSPAQRKQAIDLLGLITLEERAHALEDWPEPEPDPASLRELEQAEQARAKGDLQQTLTMLDRILQRLPAWRPARRSRAEVLEQLGRHDEATDDLTTITRLSPSDAVSWRRLGLVLAEHGGTFSAGRAEEALRHAIALEPEWTDLQRIRAELQRRRTRSERTPPTVSAPVPTPNARKLLERADELMESGEDADQAKRLLEQALRDSPAFVAAASALYALSGAVPPATIKALWNDGPQLWELVQAVRKLGREGARQQTASWCDRAVDLGVAEARFARAVARAQKGDHAGALADLTVYMALGSNPAHVEQAHALRATINESQGRKDSNPSPLNLAKIRLLEDRPEEALKLLGTNCVASTSPEQLLMLAMVYERLQKDGTALACLSIVATAAGTSPSALSQRANARLGRLAARTGDSLLLTIPEASLERASEVTAAAQWAMARQQRLRGDSEGAARRIDRYLAAASPDDSFVERATRLRNEISAEKASMASRARARQRMILQAALGTSALLALLSYWIWWRGCSLRSALRRRPALYPELARIIGELRHDVLKHRTSALGLLAESPSIRQDMRRALLEPVPTSVAVAQSYAALVSAARAQRVTLRRLNREPTLGPLVRDLRWAEQLIEREGHEPELLAIDERLRHRHADQLAKLLQHGPRTRLDASELQRWIAGVEAERRQARLPWVAPALQLTELGLEFPLEHRSLMQIFVNLLRNAQAAIEPSGKVLILVEQERDITGRNQVQILIADSSVQPLTLEMIESRESGRGLALIRDLTRRWRGHLVLRPMEPPLQKLVGVCFPT